MRTLESKCDTPAHEHTANALEALTESWPVRTENSWKLMLPLWS